MDDLYFRAGTIRTARMKLSKVSHSRSRAQWKSRRLIQPTAWFVFDRSGHNASRLVTMEPAEPIVITVGVEAPEPIMVSDDAIKIAVAVS
jgi:hypothetical protein